MILGGRAHNLKVVGSKPAPVQPPFFCLSAPVRMLITVSPLRFFQAIFRPHRARVLVGKTQVFLVSVHIRRCSPDHATERGEASRCGQESSVFQLTHLLHHPFMGSPAHPLGLGYVGFASQLAVHALPEYFRPPKAAVLISFELALVCEAMAVWGPSLPPHFPSILA